MPQKPFLTSPYKINMPHETGMGGRVINFVVDTILIALIAYGFYRWWYFQVMYWQYKFIPYYLFFFATIFVYYTVSESLFGRTPGKLLSLSRVTNLENKRPSFGQIVLRSLLRLILIDAFFIPFFDRPLHDAWSKTRVVEV